MSVHNTGPKHEAFYQDVAALLKKHAGHLTSLEMLAIASNLVGKLVAMQDQRSVTPRQAMEIVSKNVEAGNRQAIEELMKSKGSG